MIDTIIRRITGRGEAFERDLECGRLLNALAVLDEQRAVAVKTFGANDPHLAELDEEETAYRARAAELGAAWA